VKTDKLYYTDSMLSTFTATVLSCTPAEKGGFIVVLDKTAFFPEGGGQECDTGVIITEGTSGCDVEAHVRSVSEDKDGVISHLCDAELKPGSTVTGKLDFEKRFSNMQHHSGEHIMSGLIKTLFDKDNVGFHLSGGSAVFDIAGTFTDEELALLERKANKAVTDDLEIVTRIVTPEELKVIPCRSKFYDSCDSTHYDNAGTGSGPDAAYASEDKQSSAPSGLPTGRTARNLLQLPDEIRIVSIGDVDSCACCAPHVRSTGQIGLIKIMNAEHFRGGTRFTIVCGRAALDTICKLRADELEIMHMLSAKQGETPAAVKRLSDSLTAAKQSLYLKDEQIALMLMQHARTTGSRVLFCSDIDQNTARKCVNELIADGSDPARNSCNEPSGDSATPVFFFIGTDESGYRFIIGGGSDARETLAGLKKTLDIKGGGSNLMVNGTTSASRKEIEAAVDSLTADAENHVLSGKNGSTSVTEPLHGQGTVSRIVLASASPRRRELLSKLGVPFEVIVSDTDENIECADPCSLVKELALLKARDVYQKITGDSSDSCLIVIGADTVVDLDGTVLGKPKDKADAERMLRGLSGNAHQVHTGIAVIVRDASGAVTEISDSETSTVHVDTLNDSEISSYIATGEPFDKAGSYAIQGAFAPYISSIEGDYYNIVGLPLNRLYKILKDHVNF
jgi:alanyl-tRNA synthetase